MPLLITGLTFCEKPDTDPAGKVVKLQTSISADFLPFCDSVADIDGNTYKTVKIGSQIWMAENLKTTRYNDGSSILTGSGDAEDPRTVLQCFSSEEGAYTWYDYDAGYKDTYGAIYNWYSVGTGKLCPSGWHVPDESEWTTLIISLGGAVGMYNDRTEGMIPIYCPEICLNKSGFNPGPSGVFEWYDFYTSDYIWTATLSSRYNIPIIVSFENIYTPWWNWDKGSGYGVRCLKDN